MLVVLSTSLPLSRTLDIDTGIESSYTPSTVSILRTLPASSSTRLTPPLHSRCSLRSRNKLLRESLVAEHPVASMLRNVATLVPTRNNSSVSTRTLFEDSFSGSSNNNSRFAVTYRASLEHSLRVLTALGTQLRTRSCCFASLSLADDSRLVSSSTIVVPPHADSCDSQSPITLGSPDFLRSTTSRFRRLTPSSFISFLPHGRPLFLYYPTSGNLVERKPLDCMAST